MRHGVGIIVFIAAILSPFYGHAKIVAMFDKDGTLNQDEGDDAAWITPWILDRVEDLNTVAQQSPNRKVVVRLTEPEQIAYYRANYANGIVEETSDHLDVRLPLPDQILISYDEFAQIERMISRVKTAGVPQLGVILPFLLDEDPIFPKRPRLVIPGYYRVFDDTFKYYRESTGARPKNYILAHYQDARRRAELLNKTWQGRAWPLFRALMSRRDQIRNVHLFTARGNRLIDFHQWFDQLARDGEIAFSHDDLGRRPIIHAFGNPESRLYGVHLEEKKVTAEKIVLNSALQSAGAKHTEAFDPAGNPVPSRMHTFIVAENDPALVEAVAKKMLDASGDYLAHDTKFVLFNAGDDAKVARARYPYRWTVFYSARGFREARPEEIAFWLSEDCEGDLATKPGVNL